MLAACERRRRRAAACQSSVVMLSWRTSSCARAGGGGAAIVHPTARPGAADAGWQWTVRPCSVTSINIAQAVYVSQSAGAIGATTRFRDRAVRAISDRSLAPRVALSRRERAIPRLSSDVTWHGCDARRRCRSGAAARMACGSPSMAAQPRGTALLASARSGCAMMAGQSLWKAGALVVVDMRWWGIRFPFRRR